MNPKTRHESQGSFPLLKTGSSLYRCTISCFLRMFLYEGLTSSRTVMEGVDFGTFVSSKTVANVSFLFQMHYK